MPVLSNVLEQQGWGEWIVLAFLIPPISSCLSPLVIAAQADHRFRAEKIIAVILFLGAILHVLAFRELDRGANPVIFLLLFLMQCLVASPAFSLLNTVTFSHLDGRVEKFGILRVWGTVGWIVAGALVSLLGLDASGKVGYLSATANLIALVCCFFLPPTPPTMTGPASLKDKLGLGAFGLLFNRNVGAVILMSCLFMMPLTAFFMHTPLFLRELDVKTVAFTMSIGQFAEIFALAGLGWLISRFRFQTIFLIGLACGILRFALFYVFTDSDHFAMIITGIALHGVCWTLYFEAARAYLDLRAPKGFRAQAQALTSLGSSGVGSISGTLIVGTFYSQFVTTQGNWSLYWLALALWCAGCCLFFFFMFQDQATSHRQTEAP